MTWTREHDAWLARHCEGLDIIPNGPDYVTFGGYYSRVSEAPEELYKPISSYFTDPAAAIRASEAWRKKESGRWYECRSVFTRKDGTEVIAMAQCFKWEKIVGIGDGEAALAKALYRATGGPA